MNLSDGIPKAGPTLGSSVMPYSNNESHTWIHWRLTTLTIPVNVFVHHLLLQYTTS